MSAGSYGSGDGIDCTSLQVRCAQDHVHLAALSAKLVSREGYRGVDISYREVRMLGDDLLG